MVDFYWLKSFTEIIQLFISIFFILFLKKKYTPLTLPLKWFIAFLAFKILEDLFGIVNYTSWIAQLLTRPVISSYRVMMGPIDLMMLACFFVFSTYIIHPDKTSQDSKRNWYYLIPAILLIPVNFFLAIVLRNNLIEVFLLVRVLSIITLVYLLLHQMKNLPHRYFTYTFLIWNILWFLEVLFNEALGIISETASWVVFVLAELCLTIGITYYLIQVIARPKILRFEKISDFMPSRLSEVIKSKLGKAIEEDKVYTDSELTLQKLAEHLDISTNDLTLFLNRALDMNFNKFITQHRIEESKRLLANKSKTELSIEQVMYEVGFNSKSVFNTAFKANTGLTPSAYRKTFYTD